MSLLSSQAFYADQQCADHVSWAKHIDISVQKMLSSNLDVSVL